METVAQFRTENSKAVRNIDLKNVDLVPRKVQIHISDRRAKVLNNGSQLMHLSNETSIALYKTSGFFHL